LESRHIQANDMRKVVGQRVIEGLKANEALMVSDIAKFSERKHLSGLIANGMRALTLEGRSVDFDGLLRPGDRVDVLLSIGNDNGGTTSTLLQNLLALSVGGTLERADDEKQTYSRGASVVISATSDQAQVLTEALRHGKLTLTLRNSEDMTILEGIAETNSRDLLNRNAQPQRVIAAIAPAAAPTPAVKEGPNHVR
jgi:pilus assembly protein CpaB